MEDKNTTTTETTNVAENTGGAPKGNADNADAVSTNESAEKTFTQAELDAIVKQRLDRATKGQPTKEEMKAFKEWQDSQKTAEQLTAEKINAAQSAQSAAEKRAELAEAKCIAYSMGVTAEAVDDVIALAMAKVSDSVSAEDAIAAVVKKYPAFSSVPNEKKGISTGVNFGQSSPAVSGVEAAFLAKNPGLKL